VIITQVDDPAPAVAVRRPRRGADVRTAAVVAVIAALLVAYPLVVTSVFATNIGILALVFATAAVGWNLLGGYTGQVSFGHAMFFGTGAYTTAYLVINGWSPWLTIPVGMILAGVAALLVGWPTFRLRNHYFSIATIAVTQIVMIVVTNTEWLGRASGLELPIPTETGLSVLAWSPRDKEPYYYVALGMFALAWCGAALLLRGRLGVYAKAVRDDQEAAAAIGIPVLRVKMVMALASGLLAALPGGFYALFVGIVDPSSVIGLSLSVQIALIAVLGGVGTMAGPLLGAWVLIFIQEYTRTQWSSSGRSLDLLIYGALIVIVVLVEPGGLVGLARRAGGALLRATGRSGAGTAVSGDVPLAEGRAR
jgi:branched-chain amino acid transport system permease protein